MDSIKRTQDHTQIEWLARGNGAIFKLVDYPGFVIKTAVKARTRAITVGGGVRTIRLSAEESVYQRWDNMGKADKVIKEEGLDGLILPKAKLVVINGQPFIIEEALPLKTIETSFPKEAAKAVRQLIRFIELTGYSDARQGNLFLIDGFSIALPDVEEMDSVEEGLIGSDDREGLVTCVKDEQLNWVLEAAKKHTSENLETIKATRLKQIEKTEGIFGFYERHNIKGNEHIKIRNMDEFELDLDQKCDYFDKGVETQITLRRSIEIVVDEINKMLDKRTGVYSSLQERRYLDIDASRIIQQFNCMGLNFEDHQNPKESYVKRWLYQIMKALKSQGYIHDFVLLFNQVQYIQA
jgi:hypothetical protein